MDQNLTELVGKIRSSMEQLDLELVVVESGERGWKSAALRARTLTKELAPMFKEFRRQSVQAAKGK